jgi:hypothetical protein
MPEPAGFPHVLKIALRVGTRERLQALIESASIDFGCRVAGHTAADGALVVDAYVPAAMVDTLRRDGFEVDVIEDVSAAVREGRAEMGRADLFERGRPSRRGLVGDAPSRPTRRETE